MKFYVNGSSTGSIYCYHKSITKIKTLFLGHTLRTKKNTLMPL